MNSLISIIIVVGVALLFFRLYDYGLIRGKTRFFFDLDVVGGYGVKSR